MKSYIAYMVKRRFFLLVVLLLTGSLSLSGQGINEQVTVVGAFEPVVPDASKINLSPSPDETEVKLPVMSYSVTPVQIKTNLHPDDITAVKLVGEPLKKLYRNYARVGFGNYTTPYAELYAGSLRSKTYAFGIHMKHLSSSGTIKDYPKSNNSLNLVELSGQKFTDNHTIAASAVFRRNVVHHYGFKPAEMSFFVNEDDLKQRFNRINASASVASVYSDNDRLNHRVGLSFSNVSDKFDTRESQIGIRAAADKRYELFDLTDYQKLSFETNLTFTGYKDSLLSQRSALLSFRPSISTEFNQYELLFGLDLSIHADSVSKAYLFPFLEARVRALEDALMITAGISGGITRRGFDVLSDENPFIQSVLPLQYTRERFAFYAGARARVGKNVNLTASFRTANVENEPFFVNDETNALLNRFTVVYYDGSVTKFRAEAEYLVAERIRVKAFAGLEKWSLNGDFEPWHRPGSEFGVDASYDIQKKIIARAGFSAFGKQSARIPVAEPERVTEFVTETLKGYTDIHLGVEYRYTKLLSAFLNFSNVAGTRYYQWYNYPAYRFRVLGGISYSF
ncbi:MAG: hypothetical protein JNL22_01950 [Bacteroidales bacterium]|nr:hypothetical protein [Bacteroidales bacterium]